MAFPIMAVLSALTSLGGGGGIQRSNTSGKDAYYQYLMGMLNPNNPVPKQKKQGQQSGGQDDSGNLMQLIQMLGGKENLGNQTGSSFNLPASTNYDNFDSMA
jgi:hypothetical protein